MHDQENSKGIFFDANELDLSGGIKVIQPLTTGQLRYRELTETDYNGHEHNCSDPTQLEVRKKNGGSYSLSTVIKWCRSCKREVLR